MEKPVALIRLPGGGGDTWLIFAGYVPLVS